MLQNLPIMLVFMLFRNALCFYFVFFSMYRNVLHVNGEVSCAPEFIDILEQGSGGHVYSPSEAMHILLFNTFVVLYANKILCIVSD